MKKCDKRLLELLAKMVLEKSQVERQKLASKVLTCVGRLVMEAINDTANRIEKALLKKLEEHIRKLERSK